MTGIGLQVGLVLLVVVNAAFAGSEVALISLREGQLWRLDAGGGRGRLDPSRLLSTVQVGITMAGFLASAVAAVPLVGPLSFLGGWAKPTAIVVVTVLLTDLSLVLGELAPKRVALQRPEGWVMLAARPLAAMSLATRPLVWRLSRSTDLLVRLAGGDPGAQRKPVSEEEVRDMIATQASFPPEQRITIEDLLEELVGEIYDEFDRDVGGVGHESDASLLLPGSSRSTTTPSSACASARRPGRPAATPATGRRRTR